jgi:hypothetical protein
MMQQDLMETFERDSSELYWLAYLFTGNSDRGVQAFDRALDFENAVFGGFMKAWARKLIIVEALGTMEKELRTSIQRTARSAGAERPAKWTRPPEVNKERFEQAVITIEAFPRCAMLLTIFEGMPVSAASVLLNTSEALTRRAQGIGIVQLTRNLTGDPGREPFSGFHPIPALSLS